MASASTEEHARASADGAQAALPAGEPELALPAPVQTAGSGRAGQAGAASTSAAPGTKDAGPSRGGSARKWIVVLVILAAVAAAIWKIRSNTQQQAAEGQRMAAAADRPVPVQTQAVQQRTMPIYLTALGTVTAYNTVTVRSRVDGQLNRVLFREGQAVKKGQLLIEIDPRPYQAALSQAEGQLAKDQANARNADAEASRYTALYQAGVVSKESQQSQISTAGQASGTLEADQAAIQAARVNVAYTKITSPIDGVVGLRQVDAGNIVHAADTSGLVVVTQLQPIAVIFTLPEDYLPQVLKLTRADHQLAVEAYDRSETTHLASGTLLTVDNQIDTTTGTVKAKAVFSNREGTLFPNQFVNVRLILQERQNAIVVPAAAVQAGSKGSFLYVVRPGDPPADTQGPAIVNDTVKRSARGKGKSADAGAGGAPEQQGPKFWVEARPVKVDLTEGTQVILDSGVNPGDQIVVDGQEKLKDGSRVIPHAAPSRPAPASSDTASPRARQRQAAPAQKAAQP